MPADLHCHTRLSDGSLGIEDLILLAKRSGVNTIAITDHDCLAGTVRGKIIGDRHGVNVIPGVEISAYDEKNDKKVHILCYLAENPDRLEGLCRKNSLSRRKASQLMVVKASQRYPISSELVLKCAAGSTNIYKQHILHAFMECGYTTEIFGNMYDELFNTKNPDNICVLPKFPGPIEIIKAIHEAGGIAVLAHPGFYDNFDILPNLIKNGLDGVEVWHPMNSEEQIEELKAIAKKHELLMTGGSDFHGMYGSSITHLASCTTPEENLAALMGYQAKKKRAKKKAAKAAEAKGEK
ncbi:MAG: PHP domain-containing protein [Ruminococcaceae bacterium]|nr:PHP domain-containing protein [Oscillospiraceae bacterium]